MVTGGNDGGAKAPYYDGAIYFGGDGPLSPGFMKYQNEAGFNNFNFTGNLHYPQPQPPGNPYTTYTIPPPA